MIKQYSWRIQGFYKEDPELVANELEKIENLTPENVVEAARTNEGSILHNMFEWDDAIAGEYYRKSQARNIINSIKVTIIDEGQTDKAPVQIRAFVQTKQQQNYEPIEVVVQDTNKYQLLLHKAYKELNQVKNKYTELEEIQELLQDIPNV